jgi:toxin YoeB
MLYKVDLDKKAQKQLEKVKKNQKLLLKFLEIIEDIKQNPHSPNFKFERLKGNFSGYCSKRLDKKNRVIYKVLDDKIIVIIVTILGHYEE